MARQVGHHRHDLLGRPSIDDPYRQRAAVLARDDEGHGHSAPAVGQQVLYHTRAAAEEVTRACLLLPVRGVGPELGGGRRVDEGRRDVLRARERRLELIGSHQRPSEALRGAIRGHQRPS